MILPNLVIKKLFPQLASREDGALLRAAILEQLALHSHIVLDLSDVTLTPSVADEAFGLLCNHLSIAELKARVKFTHLSDPNKALILRVLGNRFT